MTLDPIDDITGKPANPAPIPRHGVYTLSDVAEYFDNREISYRVVWDLNHSHAMHCGYWDDTTRTLRQALARENEVMANIASITPDDAVLDAGCGVGGSAIWLAKHRHCKVTGITLSAHQVRLAEHFATRSNVSDLTRFDVQDFLHAGFPDSSFDVVWACESVCYANEKHAFLAEAFRLLRPGGRIVIADAFAGKPRMAFLPDEIKLMRGWLDGWAVNWIDTPDEFCGKAKDVGFTGIHYENITVNIMPSSRRLWVISFPAILYGSIQYLFGHISKQEMNHSLTLFNQYRALKRGIWQYGMFFAIKPHA